MTQPVVGIVGTGLIGGSIGLCSRRNGARVLGYDSDAQSAARALAVGALDEVVGRDELYARCETVIIASYVAGTIAELEWLAAHPPAATLILDVASVKLAVCQAGARVASFVGTHPMAGAERSGATAARADLFSGKPWAYVPSGSQALDQRARAFIAGCDADPIPVEAADHDASVAATSHLPQLMASCYSKTVAGAHTAAFERLQGPVARELLRIGRSPFPMWRDIFAANRASLTPLAISLAAALRSAADALETGDSERLARFFPAEEPQARPGVVDAGKAP